MFQKTALLGQAYSLSRVTAVKRSGTDPFQDRLCADRPGEPLCRHVIRVHGAACRRPGIIIEPRKAGKIRHAQSLHYLPKSQRAGNGKPNCVLKGDADPDLLAASVLAGRSPSKAILKKRANARFSEERVAIERARYILRLAGSRFLYFWELCYTNVESSRRASLLAFLLSLVTVVYGAFPIYFGEFNDGNRTGFNCFFDTVQRLLAVLTVEWSFCAVLYLESSFFARVLAHRRTCWNYVCARLEDELSCA